jgi:UrcA family protein
MTLLKTSAAVCAALATACGGAAAARPYPEDAMVVRLSGLNLRSDAGAQAALKRIERTADTWCGWVDIRDVARAQAHKACSAGMTAAAVKALDAPRVTWLHDARPGILLARR